MSEEKSAHLAVGSSDRKWSMLWYSGKLAASSHNDENWVILEVHKGLCEAAYDALRAEGVECQAHLSNPHISVLRPEECAELKKKYKQAWHGAAKIGTKFKFRLEKMVSVIPTGWKEMDRVWFLECVSPDLEKYRKDLGFTAIPRNPDDEDHHLRFHITFAVRRSTASKVAEILTNHRDSDWDKLLSKFAAETTSYVTKDKDGSKLVGVFDKMELDPDVTTATLGGPYKNAGIPTLLRTTQKLLNISKGSEDVDDRDSLAYQTLHSADDFFGERIQKDAGQIGRKLLWKSTLKGNLQHIPSGALTPQIRGVLLRSGMGMPLEEINSVDTYDQRHRVLRLGEGGISSLQSVPDESRSVQPSHFGYIDPIRSPESGKIGVDARLAHEVVKGSDGQFYTKMLNAKTGKHEYISASHAANSTVAYPGEVEKGNPYVAAMVKSRQVQYVKPKDVDYVLPDFTQMFSATSNMVPLIGAIKGGRLLMGAKYMVQALPLKNAEAPLVQNLWKDGKSFNELYGDQVGVIRAKENGVVTDMDKNSVTVKYPSGTQVHELYNNFPFNRKSYIHNNPQVRIGDQLKAGQVIASSNHTDKNGAVALGTNVRAAYVPYRGLNFEDAIVVSETGAKKFSSEHMYQHDLEADENTQFGRKQYISMFPSKYKKEQLSKINDEGVIKVGSVIQHGDPISLVLKRHEGDALHRGHKPLWSDASETWKHHSEGLVTDVNKTKEGGWNVVVKTYAPAEEGDKLAGSYGDKGVISKVIPDHEMLHDKDGNPLDILLNPQGINTRVNPAQVFEALLGKVARKRGEAYKLPAKIQGVEWADFVQNELSKHGLKDTEDLIDPVTGKTIPKVLTGERFIMKLHHTAESKGRGRDVGGYTSEGIPARGGEHGSKRISTMEASALISHGATEVLRDAQVVRGQRNDEFWSAFKRGFTPPSPKVPFIYQKFLGYMEGAGIHVKKDGNKMHLFGLTDKDIDNISSGKIMNSQTVNADDMSEITGGLFDRQLTGGHNGNRWSHIELTEKMPNPVMEEPIRQLLGLTQNGFEDVLSGKKPINGKIGTDAIYSALKAIDVEAAIKRDESLIKDGAKSKRDAAVKRLGYLRTLNKYNLRPEDWILSKVPVLPPSMRPITAFRGMVMNADPNYLYKDLMMANGHLKSLKDELGDTGVGEERLQLYNSFKALSGLGDPIQAKTQEKQVKGLLAHVFGQGSPKLGMLQRRVLGSPVDVVGRAAITPNPDYSMDEVGLPEDKAWTLYRPFIIRRLVRRGMPATEAVKAVADKKQLARQAMLEEMDERPVMVNRAPTLHRYGFMAAWPRLVKNETLQISPVVCAGFGADFDGDAMNYHVPVTDGAVKDAIEKMMPSRNLRSVRDFGVHYVPKNEFLMGLYLASAKDNKNSPRVFKDKKSALDAYHRGEIDLGDRVVIHEDKK